MSVTEALRAKRVRDSVYLGAPKAFAFGLRWKGSYICINYNTKSKHNNFLVMITILEIPVPIPNTEVKQNSAKNTCGLPCWEDRLSLDFFLLYRKIEFFLYNKSNSHKFA